MEEKEIREKGKKFYGKMERQLERIKPKSEIPLEMKKKKYTKRKKEDK